MCNALWALPMVSITLPILVSDGNGLPDARPMLNCEEPVRKSPVKRRRRTARLARLRHVTQASGSRSNVRRVPSQILCTILSRPRALVKNNRYQHSSFANHPRHPQIIRSLLERNDSCCTTHCSSLPTALSRTTSPASATCQPCANRHALTQCAWKPFVLVQQCLRRSTEPFLFRRRQLRNRSAIDSVRCRHLLSYCISHSASAILCRDHQCIPLSMPLQSAC